MLRMFGLESSALVRLAIGIGVGAVGLALHMVVLGVVGLIVALLSLGSLFTDRKDRRRR